MRIPVELLIIFVHWAADRAVARSLRRIVEVVAGDRSMRTGCVSEIKSRIISHDGWLHAQNQPWTFSHFRA
ncbi:MAG: hypothetical protein HW407_723 [Bacteroidetes bacterium]|nr:hypothetical protein [Bacteroidota bacterium]